MSLVARAAAAFGGAALLVLAAPARNPWSPLALELGPGRLGNGWRVPLIVLVAGLGGLAAWTALRPGRRAGSRGVLSAAAVGLALSLVPATERGAGVVSGLLLGSAGVLLLTGALADERVLELVQRTVGSASRALRNMPTRRVVGLAAAVVLAGAAAGAHFLLGRIPHVVDAAAQLFHAKILLTGRAWAPVPAPAELFRFTHMVEAGGRWFSQYPPGHVLLLAAGLLLRAPWLVNPLLGAATVVVVYLLGRETLDQPTARLAAVLYALSPFVWITSASFMNHTPTGLLVGLFLLGLFRTLGRGGPLDALLAGAALGCAMNVRPMTAAALALPFAVWAVWRTVRAAAAGRRDEARSLLLRGALMLAAFALPVAGLLAFNKATSGSPFVFGYQAAHGTDALPGFGRSGWWDAPHTPLRGLVATLNNLNALNQYLFALPLPSLALPLAGLALDRRRTSSRLFGLSVASLALAYFFYWYQDWSYGPRFFYAASVPLVLLAATALRELPEAARKMWPGGRAADTLKLTLVIAFAYAWIVNVPLMARFYSRNYADGNAAVAHAVDERALDGSLLLVPGFYYPSLFPRNAASLDGPVVYARDLGPAASRELAARYPGRTLHRLRSGDRYFVESYDPVRETGPVVWRLRPGQPLTVEALSFQLAHFRADRGQNRRTGELGGVWRNHDELRVASDGPGAEVGFAIDSERDETRTLMLALTHSPESGRVEVWLNGEQLGEPLDLWSARPGVTRHRVEGVRVRAGRNGLLLRVVGRNDAATAYELGLDYFVIE